MDLYSILKSNHKKNIPCLLCNKKLLDYNNFCAKCKKIVNSQNSPSKLHKRNSTKSTNKIFFIRPSSVKKLEKPMKETAKFNNCGNISHTKERSFVKHHAKKNSLSIYKRSESIERPQTSFDLKVNRSQQKIAKPKIKKKSKPHLYRLSKSPIPELRPSTAMSRSVEAQNSSTTGCDTLNIHKNTLTDLCVFKNAIWTVGLDYKLNSLRLLNLKVLSSKTAHSKGVVAIRQFKEKLVTAGKDGKIKMWNSKCVFQTLAHKGGVKCMDAGTGYLVTAGETVKLWENTSVLAEYCELSARSLCVVNNYSFLSGGQSVVKMWDTRVKQNVLKFESTGPFLKCLLWDTNSFWTGSDYDIKVRNI